MPRKDEGKTTPEKLYELIITIYSLRYFDFDRDQTNNTVLFKRKMVVIFLQCVIKHKKGSHIAAVYFTLANQNP